MQIRQNYVTITDVFSSFRATSLTAGQSYNNPSTSVITVKSATAYEVTKNYNITKYDKAEQNHVHVLSRHVWPKIPKKHAFLLQPSSSMNGSVSQSVCLSLPPSRPSVSLSVTHFWQCSCHCTLMKFSGVITIGKGDVYAKGQRSKVKVTEVKTQFRCFWTVTPVGIHIWQQNDAQSLMWLRSGALLFFMVILQISRSEGKKSQLFTRIGRFQTVTPVYIHRWQWNDAQSLR